MLKVWETKLEGYKRITEEVINDCQKALVLLKKTQYRTKPMDFLSH